MGQGMGDGVEVWGREWRIVLMYGGGNGGRDGVEVWGREWGWC